MVLFVYFIKIFLIKKVVWCFILLKNCLFWFYFKINYKNYKIEVKCYIKNKKFIDFIILIIDFYDKNIGFGMCNIVIL